MTKQSANEKNELPSVDELLGVDPQSEKETTERLLESLDEEDYLDAHREALAMLKETDAHLEEYVIAYERDKKDREPVEKAYTLKISILHSMARRFHPLSTYGKKMLSDATEVRKEFEALVDPILSKITGKNIDLFHTVVSSEIREDIISGRIGAIGAVRTNMGTPYGVGAIAYHVEESPLSEEGILVIDWLFVHKRFRNRDVANFLIGELLGRVPSIGIRDCFVAIPAETKDLQILAWLFGSWGFSFDSGVNPEVVLQLRELTDYQQMEELQQGVVSLGDKDPKKLLKRLGYRGYLLSEELPAGYIDRDLSCVLETEKGPAALLLTHRMSTGMLRVEYLGANGDDADCDKKLLSFFLNRACALPEDTIVSILTETEEGREFLHEVCPKQLGYYLLEGALSAPESALDLTPEDIDKMLAEV